MGIRVYSLLRVMQDLYHQPYHASKCECDHEHTATDNSWCLVKIMSTNIVMVAIC